MSKSQGYGLGCPWVEQSCAITPSYLLLALQSMPRTDAVIPAVKHSRISRH